MCKQRKEREGLGTRLHCYVCTLVNSWVSVRQGRSQDFHKGGTQLVGEVVIVRGEAVHGQLCWP